MKTRSKNTSGAVQQGVPQAVIVLSDGELSIIRDNPKSQTFTQNMNSNIETIKQNWILTFTLQLSSTSKLCDFRSRWIIGGRLECNYDK